MGKALHGQALGEFVERLQHPYWGVRLHALEQLVRIVGGYAPAVLALTALLENQDWRVRRAAVDALSEISVTVVRELTRRMVHQDKDVRIAWLQTLSLIAEKGDEQAIGRSVVDGSVQDDIRFGCGWRDQRCLHAGNFQGGS